MAQVRISGWVSSSQAELPSAIYRQRSIERFMSGLALEDMHCFIRPLTERERNFFPYPFLERDNNTNTPPIRRSKRPKQKRLLISTSFFVSTKFIRFLKIKIIPCCNVRQ
jgi:hypothetical protein